MQQEKCMSTFKRGAVFALMMAAMPCRGEDVYMGAVISAGPTFAGDEAQPFLDVAAYGGLGLWVIVGAETKKIQDERLNAVYAGLGLTGLLQAHVGASNHGAIYRIRSEFSPFALARESTIYPLSRTSRWSLNRLSVSFTYEDTFKDKGLDNFSIGLGYVFN
jgi:hypothetical protein